MKTITYEYVDGDGHEHAALRSDADAVAFVADASRHGRRILSVVDVLDEFEDGTL